MDTGFQDNGPVPGHSFEGGVARHAPIGKARAAIAGVLRYGSLISSLVMALALVLFLWKPPVNSVAASEPAGLTALLRGAARLEALALAELGVLLMLLTPILRIVAAAASFAAERDLKYLLIASGVLAIVALSIGLAIR